MHVLLYDCMIACISQVFKGWLITIIALLFKITHGHSICITVLVFQIKCMQYLQFWTEICPVLSECIYHVA